MLKVRSLASRFALALGGGIIALACSAAPNQGEESTESSAAAVSSGCPAGSKRFCDPDNGLCTCIHPTPTPTPTPRPCGGIGQMVCGSGDCTNGISLDGDFCSACTAYPISSVKAVLNPKGPGNVLVTWDAPPRMYPNVQKSGYVTAINLADPSDNSFDAPYGNAAALYLKPIVTYGVPAATYGIWVEPPSAGCATSHKVNPTATFTMPACGVAGELPCTIGQKCGPDLHIDGTGNCAPCGHDGLPTCDNDVCDANFVGVNGRCQPCGNLGEPACSGGSCAPRLGANGAGICEWKCGQKGQDCCDPNNWCDQGQGLKCLTNIPDFWNQTCGIENNSGGGGVSACPSGETLTTYYTCTSCVPGYPISESFYVCSEQDAVNLAKNAHPGCAVDGVQCK